MIGWRRASDVIDGSLYEANVAGLLWLQVAHTAGVAGWRWFVSGRFAGPLAEGGATSKAAAQEGAIVAARRVLAQALEQLED